MAASGARLDLRSPSCFHSHSPRCVRSRLLPRSAPPFCARRGAALPRAPLDPLASPPSRGTGAGERLTLRCRGTSSRAGLTPEAPREVGGRRTGGPGRVFGTGLLRGTGSERNRGRGKGSLSGGPSRNVRARGVSRASKGSARKGPGWTWGRFQPPRAAGCWPGRSLPLLGRFFPDRRGALVPAEAGESCPAGEGADRAVQPEADLGSAPGACAPARARVFLCVFLCVRARVCCAPYFSLGFEQPHSVLYLFFFLIWRFQNWLIREWRHL